MSPDTPDRRSFLTRTIAIIGGTIGSILAVVLGGSIASPAFGRRKDAWTPAVPLGDLEVGVLKTVQIQWPRQDGYLHTTDRQVVFLTRTADGEIRALSSICTHLGCRVVWDAQQQLLRCPCHGGAFSAAGEVKAGPPPRPLEPLAARVEAGRILVRI